MAEWNRRVASLITTRYLLALALIALAVTASYFTMRWAIEIGRDSFVAVRMAAEQRVSSQRICFIAHALVDATDPAERRYFRTTLRRAIKNMSARHKVLSLREQPERISPGLRGILRDVYHRGPIPFDEEVNRFLSNARTVAEISDNELSDDLPPLHQMDVVGSRSIMQTHNLIFGLLQKQAHRMVDRIQTLGGVSWLLTLGLLIAEVPLIFRPMVRRTSRSMALVESARQSARHEATVAHAAREGQARFIRTMSHELRTPLNAILFMTELMKMGVTPEKQKEYTRDIHQAGAHLLSLINDTLELSRLQAGQVLIEPAPFSIRHELDWTISLLRPLASAKGLDLSYRLSPDLAENYLADGPRVRQILVNLVGNALKFTSRGSVDVQVLKAGSAGEAADWVRFEVKDTGIGIVPAMKQRIFEEFQQADKAFASQGSGLGLAICSRLVRLMHGQIGVESVPGGGSLFWFTLPLQRTQA